MKQTLGVNVFKGNLDLPKIKIVKNSFCDCVNQQMLYNCLSLLLQLRVNSRYSTFPPKKFFSIEQGSD